MLNSEIQRKEGNPPEIETTIGADTLKSTYKNWAEKASTSPSGRHLGLYKAWLIVPEEKDDNYSGLTSHQFFKIIGDIMAIAKKHNIVLHRWSTVNNIFILKQKGNIKSHRLRFLHKLESELNTVRRELITRRIMPQAEKLKHLSEDQHGGQNGQ